MGGSDVDRANQGHKVECRMLAGPDVANYKSYLRPLNLNFHGSSTFAKQSYSRQIRVNFRRGCVYLNSAGNEIGSSLPWQVDLENDCSQTQSDPDIFHFGFHDFFSLS